MAKGKIIRPSFEVEAEFNINKKLDDIIDYVTANFTKITYTRSIVDGKPSYDPSIKRIKQNTNDNVYFIIDIANKLILYVGKSKKINTRIREHLISSNEGTHTKTNDLCDFLEKQFNSNSTMEIGYSSIRIKPINYYGAGEGYLITRLRDKYLKTNPEFEMWNVRED
jgi:hypothetical protein